MAKVVRVAVRTIQRWLLRSKAGDLSRTRGSLEGECPSLWYLKWSLPRQSVKDEIHTKNSQNLKSKGFLSPTLRVRPYKPQIQPKLPEKQRAARLRFCNERKKWLIDDEGFYSRISFKTQVIPHSKWAKQPDLDEC